MTSKIYLDHVAWQPTSNCQASCPGCYIQNSLSASYRGPVKDSIVSLIYEEQKVVCKQFTISLDSIPKPPQDVVDILNRVWSEYVSPPNDLPELCVTAQSWTAVLYWVRAMEISEEQFLNAISILSLSNLPTLGKVCAEVVSKCQLANTRLNYNRMADKDLSDSKAFEMGLRYTDQTYLVLKKAPLGQRQNDEDVINWFKARAIARKQAPGKAIDDTCMRDSERFSNTQLTCNAGIHKLHVWPDGHVTGCPYDSYRVAYQSEKDTWSQIQDIINDKTPCMSHCSISHSLKRLHAMSQDTN